MEDTEKRSTPCVDCGEPCDKGKKRCPNCWELAEQLPWEGGDVRR